jgi:hypothetical protein
VEEPDEHLDQMLSELQTAEFIYEQPASSDIGYTFKYALTQEIAYNSILVERCRMCTSAPQLCSKRFIRTTAQTMRESSRALTTEARMHKRLSSI